MKFTRLLLYARLWKQAGLYGNNDNIRLKVKSATMATDEVFQDSEEGIITCGRERIGFMEKTSFESLKVDLVV